MGTSGAGVPEKRRGEGGRASGESGRGERLFFEQWVSGQEWEMIMSRAEEREREREEEVGREGAGGEGKGDRSVVALLLTQRSAPC